MGLKNKLEGEGGMSAGEESGGTERHSYWLQEDQFSLVSVGVSFGTSNSTYC